MSANGQLNQGQRIAMVTNNPALLASGRVSDLAEHQLGIFQKSKNAKCDPFLATNAPEFRKDLRFKIAQGTKDRLTSLTVDSGVPNLIRESIEFSGRDIRDFQVIRAKHSTKEDIVAIGYDGVDLKKTMTTKLGQKLPFYVHLTGGVINMLTGHTRGLNREYYIDPACVGDCDDPCGTEACTRIQSAVMEQILNDKWNRIPITALMKATTITSCTPAQTLTGLVEYTYWCITQCDEGGAASLGLIQAQYPGRQIQRIRREGSNSTYQFIQPTADPAPAALSNAALTAIPDCATCPAGYTYTANQNVFEVKVPCGGAAPALLGQTAAVLLSKGTEFDVYQVTTSQANTVAAIIAAGEGKTVTTVTSTFTATGTNIIDTQQNGSINSNGAPINHEALRNDVQVSGTSEHQTVTGVGTTCLSVLFVGVSRDTCILTTPTTAAWATCGTCNRAPKDYQITLKDNICDGSDRLDELQAAYPNLTISISATGTCAHTYTAEILSNCFPEGCSQEAIYWVRPESYQGIGWEEVYVAPPTTAPVCSCGIILEGIRYRQTVDECTLPFFDYDSRFEDPVHISVSTHNHDYTTSICETTDIPFTVLQTADMPLGQGRAVIKDEEESMSYFLSSYNSNPVIRQMFGYNYITDPNGYYDEYQLTIAPTHGDAHYFNSGADGRTYIYRFFFPEGQGKAFERAINTLVTSAGLDITTSAFA